MKCPECAHDQKVKYGMVCSCGYRFTFNPKLPQSRGFTDGKLLAAARRAAQGGASVYTDNQLYAAYVAKARSPRAGMLVVSFMLAVGGLMVMLAAKLPGFIMLGVAGAIFGLSFVIKASMPTREQFLTNIRRWLEDGKELQGLIQQPSLHTPPENWSEHDIYDYGVERILIVQRDLLVDLMVKNQQHAEQRMIVISESGYPDYLMPHVNRLLVERSDLPVYLLHDADTAGTGLSRRVHSLPWLNLGSHPVIDMGFFPEDFEKLKRTKNFENHRSERSLPADALLMGSLVTGMGACFATRSTFAEELMREHQNQMNASSSFG